jgi:predicted RNA binding protein YcfA (HicA-like mRNA interferase family)
VSLRPVPARKVIKLLNKVGFQTIRQRGSHVILKHPDGRVTVVPIHPGEDIGRGLLLQRAEQPLAEAVVMASRRGCELWSLRVFKTPELCD